MLNTFQAVILAIVQGVSELFPISSLGHSVIIPALFKFSINSNSTTYLAFVVMLHLGTALALIAFFYKDWIVVIKAVLNSIANGRMTKEYNEHLGYLLIVGSIPVLVLGYLLEKKVAGLFSTPLLAALFLIINGFILLIGESIRKNGVKKKLKNLKDFSYVQAFIVGVFQCFALVPGVSRSGSSIVGGISQGLDYEESAKFSFMLAGPVILAAAIFEFRHLTYSSSVLMTSISGAIVAGICAFLSTKFLMRYFKRNTLMPFVYYCWLIGLICLYLFKFVI